MNRIEMEARTKQMALRVICLIGSLPSGPIRDVLGRQLLKAGTSVGANYCEAQRASSRRHFITILEIANRESRENLYWLDLLAECKIVKPALLANLRSEVDEIIAILTATCKTAKQRSLSDRKNKKD